VRAPRAVVCVCARARMDARARAPAWDARRLGHAQRPRPDFGARYVEGNCVCAMWVVCGIVVTHRGACVPSRRATHSVLFVVGVGVQGLACWNAEFSVEQVILNPKS